MTLPVLGAAMAVGDISRHRDWLLEAPRPLEIQDFIFSGVLDGDWKTLADIALKKLDGHQGPLGIHGPFWDLSLSATDPLIREVVRKRFLQALDVCAHLGADLMVVHSPFTDWHEQNGFMFGGDPDIIEYALATMTPVADRAREVVVTLWRAEGRVHLAVGDDGTGIADDKAIYSYMPDIIKFYTGEKAILKNVPTWRCSDSDSLAYVLDHLQELVVKEVHGSGGYGMLVGPAASKKELAAFRAKLTAKPGNYIAQPTLALSTVPILTKAGLAPRHGDLRPFALYSPRGVEITPGGLTRVALKAGSLVVNSSQGGGTKDTWVLEDD